VLRCAVMCCSINRRDALERQFVLLCVGVCCSASQCIAMCCGVLKCAAVCCSVLQRVHAYIFTYVYTYIYRKKAIHSRPRRAKAQVQNRQSSVLHCVAFSYTKQDSI